MTITLEQVDNFDHWAAERLGWSHHYKDEVWWGRWLGVIPIWKRSVTTLGTRIYWPSLEARIANSPIVNLSIMMHEYIHCYDQRRCTWPVFYFTYLFTLPIFFTIRSYWEIRAYWMDLLLIRWYSGD